MAVLSKYKGLTHGEAFVLGREDMDFRQDLKNILNRINNLPKRMNRNDALKYYKAKFKKYFGTDELTPRDFQKIEWYYDYFEMQRLMDKLIIRTAYQDK
jgi:hypothetical protein